MVAGVRDAQHSQAVPPLPVSGAMMRSSPASAHAAPVRPLPRTATPMVGAQQERA